MAKSGSKRSSKASSSTAKGRKAAGSKATAAKATAGRAKVAKRPATSKKAAAAPKAGAPRVGRGRGRNKFGLVESLHKVLKGKIFSVSDAAVAVKKAGYKTDAVNFRVMVNQAFIKYTNLFKRVSHGKYTGL
jgi:hypothetical protein